MDSMSCRSHNFCTAIFIIDDIHTVPVGWLLEKAFNSNITMNIATFTKRQVIQHKAGYDLPENRENHSPSTVGSGIPSIFSSWWCAWGVSEYSRAEEFHPDSEMCVSEGPVQTEEDFKTSRQAEEGVMRHMLPSNIFSRVCVFVMERQEHNMFGVGSLCDDSTVALVTVSWFEVWFSHFLFY